MEEVNYFENVNYVTYKPLYEKYKPVSTKDIIGNKKGISSIVSWLDNFEMNQKYVTNKKNQKDTKKKRKTKTQSDDNETLTATAEDENETSQLELFENKKYVKSDGPFSNLLIIGSHGIGKTSSIYAILNEKKYTINNINFHKLKTTKNVNELLDNIKLKKNNVYEQLYGEKHKKTAVIIDNLESITTLSEKMCIKKIIEINEEKWLFPLIFITNTQHSKFINEIDKKSHTVRLFQPFPDELRNYTIYICKSEKLNISDNKIYDKIVLFSQKDIRKILYIIQDMQQTFGKESIDMNRFNTYITMFKKKDIDITLISSTKMLLQNYIGISNILKQHENEKVTLPLMVHQNYIDFVNLQCDNEIVKFNLMSEISKYLSYADVIENYMYGFQIWNLYEVQGIYSCVIPSYYINEYTDNSMSDNIGITYTKDPNRTSIKKINKKNKLNINKVLKNLDIMDCVYINQIMKDLMETNKLDQCKSLLSGYKLSLSNLDTLLKIDKTKTSKTIMDSNIRSKLTSIINNPATIQKKRNNKVTKEPKTKKKDTEKTQKSETKKLEKYIEKSEIKSNSKRKT
jgi:DNA polymerase III delta prime subunit